MERKLFKLHQILEKRELTESTFVLRFERLGLDFRAGQHISVGPPNGIHTREYSVYSSPDDDALEILVREVEGGLVSPVLKKLQVGDSLVVQDSMGYFTLDPAQIAERKHLFIASGTGISPFHSFVQTYSDIDYTILHGVRHGKEAYERHRYQPKRYVACTSRDAEGDYYGRVTDYLKEHPVTPDTHCYMCGNYDMIHEVYDILENQGVPAANLHAEVYF
ncbi:ferredoxin--NADP+ reductase/benzoate/toluate 1,2-dioxygenase reductase subunit [Breznakibacter xylanolyticus]|uniref:Ferredoxin--NADP+ reductase/benzoate/toluate 1,2-dioxygenase reductase subunit n=1 Tax=Breznakibacter xylanolyticus TaxID=990 RepID=A0A2W7NMK7_9BACT|nr:FAD-binding oxidoreductase [Breznakibacter xylanolyticus]MBN2743234.1 oxidoreductase [Marinilabiliaceae bacterium]PZX14406.1 ferredoxin--NADP+ reductase/benzoate/toluate 1,2-dioxygenase reductase subunit [Breznakibacter xylanolyticus]